MPLTYVEGAELGKQFIHAVDEGGNNVSVVALHPDSAGGGSGGGGAVFDFELLLVVDDAGKLLVRRELITDPESNYPDVVYADLTNGFPATPTGSVRPWVPGQYENASANDFSMGLIGTSALDVFGANPKRFAYRLRNKGATKLYLGHTASVNDGNATIVLEPGATLSEENLAIAGLALFVVSDAENGSLAYTVMTS